MYIKGLRENKKKPKLIENYPCTYIQSYDEYLKVWKKFKIREKSNLHRRENLTILWNYFIQG